jgi:hypothetical protein
MDMGGKQALLALHHWRQWGDPGTSDQAMTRGTAALRHVADPGSTDDVCRTTGKITDAFRGAPRGFLDLAQPQVLDSI